MYHLDLSTGDSGLGDIVGSSDQPAEDIVLREFADYMVGTWYIL